MQFWRVTLLVWVLACFFSFAWAIKRHFVSSRMSIFMHLTALLGLLSTGLQIFAIFKVRSIEPIQLLISSLLYGVSLLTFWWTVSVTRSRRLSVAFSKDAPRYLLQDGPYRFVRHPFYSAYSLFWLAGLIAVLRWYLIPAVAVMLVFYFCAARMEEAKFESSHLSEIYETYRSTTGMFLPRLRGSRRV